MKMVLLPMLAVSLILGFCVLFARQNAELAARISALEQRVDETVVCVNVATDIARDADMRAKKVESRSGLSADLLADFEERIIALEHVVFPLRYLDISIPAEE